MQLKNSFTRGGKKTLSENSPMNNLRNRGFTFVELLVVLAILVTLASFLLPAVQQVREVARRSQCHNNLTQIGIALNNYRMAHGVLPPGTQNETGPIQSKEAGGYHMSWLTQILPYIEQQNAYRQIDFTKPVYNPANASVRGHYVPLFICPSIPIAGIPPIPPTCYFGVHNDVEVPIDVNQNGVLFLNSSIEDDQISDGNSYTIFVMEGTPDIGTGLGWMSGSRSALRNAVIPMAKLARPTESSGDSSADPKSEIRYEHHTTMLSHNTSMQIAIIPSPDHVGGAGSFHPMGTNCLFGDGAVRFISITIDTRAFRNLANRADGELLQDF